MNILRREIHPQIKVLDAKAGIVEYVASDESLDSYGEIVCASGARFARFEKNAPFVDSHNYESIDCLLGKVVGCAVQDRQVVETVQWAIDVPQNFLAQKGYAMTEAGYLKAVSIGFFPTQVASPAGRRMEWHDALAAVSQPKDSPAKLIHMVWEQCELSACIIGANGNAVARAYKAGLLNEADLERISQEYSKRTTVAATDSPGAVAAARRQARERFLVELQFTLNKL